MKTKIFYILIIAIIGFSSCSKQDPNDISGEWDMIEFTFEASLTTQILDGEPNVKTTTGSARDINVVMDFNDKKGTFTTTGDYTVDAVSNDNGTITNSSYKMSNFLFDGTWKQNGDTVVVTSDSQVLNMVIDEISESNLSMTWDMVQAENIFGSSITTQTKGAAKFTR